MDHVYKNTSYINESPQQDRCKNIIQSLPKEFQAWTKTLWLCGKILFIQTKIQ